ncbi:choline transporter-like protein 1 isoform X2 [Bradysia coprophila]|uniref:choline transporter-like protein 1 isoform X2 n=1 Tax=Bradysia coprophila TaxID=38358 RepID=UPI00187D900F|nr:choline transporter-like protein 1 isoform X2 [Bradysia coprophila]
MIAGNSQERKPTDVPALYFCTGFVLLIFGGFVGYALFNASIFRLINGIDDCGNVCGRTNDDNTINFCGSNNKVELPFTLVLYTKDPTNPNNTISHSTCVKSCNSPEYVEIVNRCFLRSNGTDTSSVNDKAFLHTISNDLVHSWSPILISCVVALIFSYILLILFRYAIKYVIWVIYIGLIVLLVVGAIVFTVFYFKAKSSDPESQPAGFLAVAGVLALLALILGFIIFMVRRRIRLVVQLFKEASKTLGDVPLIVLEPLLTFLAMGLATAAFLYFYVMIESSGKLKSENDENGKFFKALYVKDIGCHGAYYINLVAYIWFTQFILGCQHFVIASTVSQWFFARTKSKLDSPISRAFHHLLRIHIGSICLGSIFITIVKIIRMLVEGATNSMRNSDSAFAKAVACCCEFIVEQLERLLKYLVRNAYIIVALDGTPLIESGQKAFRLLTENLKDVLTLNHVGDFVLFLGRIFVTLIAGFISYEVASRNDSIEFKFIPIILSVILAFLIIHCFMTVYEMTLDTIFICFCVDCEQNDGQSRPYFMSRKMMEVMMELKGEAGGEFTNFGAFKHVDASAMPMMPYGQVENGKTRPMIPQNYQFFTAS